MTLRRAVLACALSVSPLACARAPIEAPTPTANATTTTPALVPEDASMSASASTSADASAGAELEASAPTVSREPLQVSARHILVRVGDFPNAKKRTLRQAHAVIEEVKKRLAAGDDFADLAKLYSEDPGTARAGGDLGSFPRGHMVKPFEDAVFALAPYEVTVVETVFGVHLVQRTR